MLPSPIHFNARMRASHEKQHESHESREAYGQGHVQEQIVGLRHGEGQTYDVVGIAGRDHVVEDSEADAREEVVLDAAQR